jgi:hypothetical protein
MVRKSPTETFILSIPLITKLVTHASTLKFRQELDIRKLPCFRRSTIQNDTRADTVEFKYLDEDESPLALACRIHTADDLLRREEKDKLRLTKTPPTTLTRKHIMTKIEYANMDRYKNTLDPCATPQTKKTRTATETITINEDSTSNAPTIQPQQHVTQYNYKQATTTMITTNARPTQEFPHQTMEYQYTQPQPTANTDSYHNYTQTQPQTFQGNQQEQFYYYDQPQRSSQTFHESQNTCQSNQPQMNQYMMSMGQTNQNHFQTTPHQQNFNGYFQTHQF